MRHAIELRKDEHFEGDALQKANVNSSDTDVCSTTSILESFTQTDLTSDALSNFLPEFTTIKQPDAVSSVYTDADSNDELLHPDEACYVMPEYVAIKLSQRPRILLKDSKKTMTVTVDSKHLENDEIKLTVSDWPIGDFNLEVGGFEVFPKCSSDLPEGVFVSTKSRKVSPNESIVKNAKPLFATEGKTSRTRSRECLISMSSSQSTKLGVKHNKATPLKPHHSHNPHPQKHETSHVKGHRFSHKNDPYVHEVIWKLNDSSIHRKKGNNVPLHNQKTDKYIRVLDENKVPLREKEERTLVSKETQTLVHIDPASFTDEKSCITDNTLMLISKVLEKSEGLLSKSTDHLKTFISKENTEGQMWTCDFTDHTLNEVPEIPECSIYNLDSENKKSDEEVTDTSDKGMENMLDVVEENLPKESQNKDNVHPDTVHNFHNDPKLYKNLVFFDYRLIKAYNFSDNCAIENSQKTETNINPNTFDTCVRDLERGFISIEDTGPQIPNDKIPQKMIESSRKDQTVPSVGGTGAYETYTRAKSALLTTMDALEKEMGPLRNELNRLQYEFKSLNFTGEDVLSSARAQDPTVFFSELSTENPFGSNSFQAGHASPQFPFQVPNHEFQRYFCESPGFAPNVESCLCVGENCLDGFHDSEIRSQQEYNEERTTGASISSSNLHQDIRSYATQRNNDFRQSSFLSDPDDII